MNENTEHNQEIKQELEENLSLEELQEKVSQLQSDLLAMETKAANNWELLLRAKAEEENLRRRLRIDIENAHKYGIEKLARSMVNVVDTLELGIGSTIVKDSEIDFGNNGIVKSLKDGMELTLKLLLDSLEQFGIKVIDPGMGETFNPNKHEAISMQEHLEFADNSILTVVQKGFSIHDRILRPARVIVSKRA